MEQSSDNLKDVYKEIGTIDSYFGVKKENGKISLYYDPSFLKYCNYSNNTGKGGCNDYFQWASCGFIYLVETLKKYILDYDKLAEYAILWLCYKLNIAPNGCDMNLVKFYNNHIEKNNDYKKKINGDDSPTYKDIIDKKKYLMNIKEIPKFNALFYILFLSYNLIDANDFNCTDYSSFPTRFVSQFKELNKNSNNIKGSLYTQILSTLSNDYKNIKNIYHEKKSCEFPPLPELTPKNPEGTSSSSSILNTLIPGLSTFAIPVFLGVAYKTIYKKKIKKSKEENET
ncbi:PIR protein CIR protein [Plasmodium vinckei vinckei]|uniref:PIR protein CIR protein n=1 Tax=Plasmodium vinckei vinckei TaxID=54757 RepID=A0A449BQB3_PLAVN|nr:PIR protein CIR protein [Plasmodium vinckei vinckei]VEV55624.1 PIR protein CIR protein [Plasmodium vinckei vinckei]